MMEGRGRSGAPHVSEERGRPGAPLVMEGRGQLGATAPSTKDNLVSEAAVKNLYARIHMHSFVARNKAAECARKLAVAQAKKVPRNLDNCVWILYNWLTLKTNSYFFEATIIDI